MQQGGPQHGAPPPDMSSPVSSHPPAPGEPHAESDEQEPERGPVTGNRWPQAETIVMLKIRSEMDAEFREATLKGPMWEEVSRRLGEQGFRRSGKKCREKFENVQKYYKRTKGHHGKSYRFFSHLEALHSNPTATPTIHQPTPLSSLPPAPAPASHPGLFSAMSLSYSDSEETEDGGRKRKRSGRMEKTMAFFKGMMSEVIDRQEAMQLRFLEALDKRDLQRTAREEEWRRQEALRVARRDEATSQERAAAAGRDAAIMALLQKLARQLEPIAVPVPVPESHIASAMDQQQELAAEGEDNHPQQVAAVQEPQLEAVLSGSNEVSSSRWPKSEVQALIEIRTSMDNRYQLAGPKGPLWEEISAAMTRQGYNKSAKRCKEKWENINKYFKRVKESSKSRPEDAKTCPYFHQLDALYRSKSLVGSGSSTPIPFEVPPPPDQRPLDGSADQVNELGSNGDGSTSEGGQEGIEKPEDILMELMDGQRIIGGHRLWKKRAFTGENHNQMQEGSIPSAVEEDSANVGKQTMSSYKLEQKRLKVSGSSISHMDNPTSESCSQFLAITL